MPQTLADKLAKQAQGPAAGDSQTPAAPKKVVISKKALICQVGGGDIEEWALDTAAACDIANEKVRGTRDKNGSIEKVWTAGGVVTSDETVIRNDVLPGEAVRAQVLADTPNALQLGSRCARQGYGFYWHP